MIGEPGLHTNKDTSVKSILRSYKLGQTNPKFVVGVHFFSVSNTKFQVIFSPKLEGKKKLLSVSYDSTTFEAKAMI